MFEREGELMSEAVAQDGLAVLLVEEVCCETASLTAPDVAARVRRTRHHR